MHAFSTHSVELSNFHFASAHHGTLQTISEECIHPCPSDDWSNSSSTQNSRATCTSC